MASEIEISTVKSQQQIKSLKDEIRVLFKHMQDLNKVFNKHVTIASSLSGMLSGKLTPAEKKVATLAKGAESAFVRQAKATNSLRERVLNFTQALKLSGATQQQQKFILQGVTKSLTKFQKSMSSGVLTARQFQEAQARVNRTLGGSRRSLSIITAAQNKQSAAAKEADKSNSNLKDQLRNIGSSAIFAVGPLSGIGARINALGAIASRAGVKIALFAASFVGLAVAIFKTIAASLRAALAFQKIESALTVATGSLTGARDAFKFVKDISLELGLNLKEAADQFAQLAAASKGTALEGEGIRKVFLGTSKAIVALGLSTDQATGVFRALQQMMSKGTVQAEELRGQLGERLPGAFQIAAIAMKTTTAGLGKMLELGKVLADDLLPKLGEEFEKRFGEQAVIASKNLRAAINRLSTANFLFALSLDETIGSAKLAAGVMDSLSRVILNLVDNMEVLIAGIGAVTAAFLVLSGPGIIRGLIKLGSVIRTVAISLFGLGAAITGGAGLAVGLALAVAAAATGVVVFSSLKDSLDNASASQAALILETRRFIDVVKEAEGATEAAIQSRIRLSKIGIKTLKAEIEALEKVVSLPAEGGFLFELSKALGRITGFTFPTTSDAAKAKEALSGLSEELETLISQLGELDDAPRIDLGADAANKKVTDLIAKLSLLENVLTALGTSGGLAAGGRVRAEDEARKIVGDLPDKSISAQLSALGVSGGGRKELIEELTDLILKISSVGDEVSKLESKLESLPKSLDKLILTSRTELEKYNDTMRELGELRAFANQTLQAEELARALKAIEDAGKKAGEALTKVGKIMKDVGDLMADALTDAILKFEGLIALLDDLAERLLRFTLDAITRSLVDQAVSALGGTQGTQSGGIIGSIFGLFGGNSTSPTAATFDTFAHGGRPRVGKVSIIGEEGPELFKPDQAGTIIPGPFRSGDTIEVNINGVSDFDSFRRSRSQVQSGMALAWQRSKERNG